jgi:lipid A 3-O-deacylase
MRVVRALISLLLSTGLVRGGEESVGGTLYLTFDNDFIADSDDGYTSGFQLGWVSGGRTSFADAPLVPDGLGRWLDGVTPFAAPGRQRFVAYSLAQRIFTPQDIGREDVVAGDLPYTGLLAVSGTAAAQSREHLDAATLTLGVVGEPALGEPTQRYLHRLTGNREPRGWDHQLDPEPLLNLQYEHRWRALAFQQGATNGDLILSGSGALGNMMTIATGSVGLRWGHHVPDDFFVPPPFFGEETVGALPYDPRRRGTVAVYVAASVDAAAFANLIYLDGNTVSDSHSVDHDHWYVRGHLGLHVEVGRFAFAVTLVRATLPWDRPDGATWETYGRISLGYRL